MNELRLPLKMTYDSSANAAYIYFAEETTATGAGRTVQVEWTGIRGMVNLDLDSSGHIMGIEVINASKILPAALLAALRAG